MHHEVSVPVNGAMSWCETHNHVTVLVQTFICSCGGELSEIYPHLALGEC